MSISKDLWVKCSLEDVVHISPEQVHPSSIPSDAWVLELEDVEKDSSKIIQKKTAGERPLKSAKNAFRKGDVLFGRLRPNLNKVVLAKQSGFCSTEMIPLRPKNGLHPQFLYWWLQHPTFREYAVETSHGLNMPRLGTKALHTAPFLLAPTSHQEQTVMLLEPLRTKVVSAKDRLELTTERLKNFRAAVLSAAVRGLLTAEWRINNKASTSGKDLLERVQALHLASGVKAKPRLKFADAESGSETGETLAFSLPEEWAWISAADAVNPGDEIVYGIVQPGPDQRNGVPYVRGLDIVEGQVLVQQLLKTTTAIAERYRRSALRSGDVLLGIIRATKVAVVPPELAGANITQGTARLRPSCVTSTEYLAIALESPPVQEWLHKHYRGIDMPGLNLADVRRLPLPLPPLEEQEQIIERVTMLMHFADGVSSHVLDAITHANSQWRTTLISAFQGAFVRDDHSDQTATALLAAMNSETRPPQVLDRTAAKREKSREKLTKVALLNKIKGLPTSRFRLSELTQTVSSNYEVVRELLFELLTEQPVQIKQVFNEKTRSVEFERLTI